MTPKIYEAIEQAVAQGVPPQYVADGLIRLGWPPNTVNYAISTWLATHGKPEAKTGFTVWLKKYHKQALPAVIMVVIINVFDAGIALLKPWPIKIMADSAFGNIPAPGPLLPYTHTPTLILYTSLMTISLFVFGALFGFVRDFSLLKLGFWLNRSIKEESFRHILHLPLFHQQRLAKGDYVYRQNVVTSSLSDLVLSSTASIAGSIIMIIGVLAIMMTFSVSLTLVSITLIPILFVTMRVIGPRLGKYAKALTEVNSDTASKISEAVDNAETVQAFTLEEKQLGLVNNLWFKSYELTKKSLLWSKVLSSSNGFMVVLATSVVMYFGGTAAMEGRITFGELLIFMTYMGYLLGPVENLVTQITTRNQKLIDVHRVFEVLNDHAGIETLRKDAHIPGKVAGHIELRGISYNYNDNHVLKNVNLMINAGEKVAIIGPSGGGKSTLLKMIPLFIEPEQGKILFDNIDIQTVSLQEVRRNVAWVAQSPQLFSGTIVENLFDGDVYRHLSAEEMMHAIDVANVEEFAEQLPMGVNTPTGENGGSLSGGQRQRVAIARALLKQSPIICLDEPTAALDQKSENFIRDSLSQMIKGRTVVMVTHRKPLLALMDTIYVLENGVIRNVKEIGGLDTYLAKLEGLEEQAEATKAKEQASRGIALTPEVLAKLRQHIEQQVLAEQDAKAAVGTKSSEPIDAINNEGTIYFH